MKHKLIIFDMDGTIADTSPGILNSHRHANSMMGKPIVNEQLLVGVIGSPLLEAYKVRFGFSAEDARRAVQIYRTYYQEQGIYQANVYPQIPSTLKKLKDFGALLAVASLKAERFLPNMLERMGIAKYFDAVYGMDDQDTRTKAGLVNLCMERLRVSKTETILIGDSIHDYLGAKESGVDFLGVTYGFDLRAENAPDDIILCDEPSMILELI